MNFAWSFKPFFILFIAIFGIDLEVSKERSKWGNYLIKLLAFFWFFCYNMSMSLSLIIAGLERNSNASLTMNMNDKLQFILPAILTTMFHVSFLVACFKKMELAVGKAPTCPRHDRESTFVLSSAASRCDYGSAIDICGKYIRIEFSKRPKNYYSIELPSV